MTLQEKVQEKGIIQYAKENSLEGKTVLLRIDVNVTLNNLGKVEGNEDWRILRSYQTIDFLVEHGSRVIIMSHIGREPNESLFPVFEVMHEHLPMTFVSDDYYTKDTLESIQSMRNGSVIMLENLRSYEGETANNAEFLVPIANLCDLYVNDAFSVSHRPHASVHAITKFLPSYFGIQMEQEVSNLSLALTSEGTKTLVLGGAKFGTKLSLLEKLLPNLSYVLMGGALANVFLKGRGFQVGTSFIDTSVDIASILHSEKILLPIDVVDGHGDVFPIDEMTSDDAILDIGHETEALFGQIIAGSDVIIWNGPMGKYEDGYTSGSLAIAESIGKTNAFSVTGGGDTAGLILANDAMDGFTFVSTGGGAMLDFLVEGSLLGIEAILSE